MSRKQGRRPLHHMTPEEIARTPHAELLGLNRHDMAKLTPSQIRAIQEANNRTRRKTVMKGVRADEAELYAGLADKANTVGRAQVGITSNWPTAAEVLENSEGKTFAERLHVNPARIAEHSGRDLTPAEMKKVTEYALGTLLSGSAACVKPGSVWRPEDVATMIEIKARCTRLALDWSAPPGMPVTANNAELLVMNAARLVAGIQAIWRAYGFHENATDAAWDSVAHVIGEQVPAFDRVMTATKAALTWFDASQEVHGWYELWLHSSFARLEVGHQLAAALCCTDVPPELEVHAPWNAWSLIVPDGLLAHWQIARVWCLGTEWIALLTKEGKLSGPIDGVVGDMVRSLIRGACLAISDPAEHRKPGTQKPQTKHGKQRSTGEPNFEQARFLLAKPVSIDLREHVAAAASGRTHSAPKVQFLVRGHWREQVHGPKRALRKRIWIEPFWKGPEEARILLRAHALEKEPTE